MGRYVSKLLVLSAILLLVTTNAMALSAPSEASPRATTYYVATDGSDTTGDGSNGNPWATINHARATISDGDTVMVKDGTYTGSVSFGRTFTKLTTFRAQNPYKARLTMSSGRVSVYGGQNLSIEGFEIYGQPGHSEYLIHVSWATTQNVTFKDNIIHDSYDNDLIKVNDRVKNVNFTGNLMYNPFPSVSQGNELMDINTVTDIRLEDNIFLNDFAWSGRTSNNQLHPLILIKNSGSQKTSERFQVHRNIFLNWDGRPDQPFLLLGEDAKPFHEAEDVLIENNLFIGNSDVPIEAAFGVKCAKNVTFRANTIAGDMPNGNWAYAYRLNTESASSPDNEDIYFYNNIWSDPNGTMNDFSDGPQDQTTNGVLDNNLYWNGGNAIPVDTSVLNFTNDANAIVADPKLGDQTGLVLPRWHVANGQFVSGNHTIREEFVRLATAYGRPAKGSPAIDNATPSDMPKDDILGNLRANQGLAPDIGAFEYFDPMTFDLTLAPADITFSDNAPINGQEVTINATVHNLGSGNATNVEVDFYDGDPGSGGVLIATTQVISTVLTGASASAEVVWNTTDLEGAHDIFVVADPQDGISELDEGNNEASAHLEVAAYGPLHTLTVSPQDVTMTTDQTQQYTAAGQDQYLNTVPITPTWSVDGGGTVNATGMFEATTPGNWTITAQASTLGASSNVTVIEGALDRIVVTPATVTMTTDDHQLFQATCLDSDDNVLQLTVTWDVDGGGTMDQDGNFTATTPGNWTVHASVSAISGNASITVTPGGLDRIDVVPPSVTLSAGEHQMFSATGYDADGNILLAMVPTWDVDGGGVIGQEGNFTATTAGQWTVFANASGVSGTATIDVTPGELDHIIVLPDNVTLEVNDTQQFAATGLDANGNEVPITPKWGAEGGGTMDANGLFTAKESGNWTVYATQFGIIGRADIIIPSVGPPINPSDKDGDGLPDEWENEHFGNLTYGPNDDPDKDDLTNLQEYLGGTDPTVSDKEKKKPVDKDDGMWGVYAITATVAIAVVVAVIIILLMMRRGRPEPVAAAEEEAQAG